jgi:hypothetical protein
MATVKKNHRGNFEVVTQGLAEGYATEDLRRDGEPIKSEYKDENEAWFDAGRVTQRAKDRGLMKKK